MKKRAFIYVIIAGVLWGTSGIFFNLLKPFGFSPLQMTAMRGVVSGIVMFLYALICNRAVFKISLKEFITFACSGVSVFGTASCYYAAIDASSVSTAVILMYTAPVFVMAYSVAFLGEKLNLPKIVAVILMIIGCALVSGIIGGMKMSILGVALGLASGLAYSAYNIFTKIEMMHKSSSLSATLYCFMVMGAVSLMFSNPSQIVEITSKNPQGILPLIIGIGVCTCVLPYMFYTLALKDIPAGTASALSIIEPMSATIFSILIFHDKIDVFGGCGIILILVAVFILNKSVKE